MLQLVKPEIDLSTPAICACCNNAEPGYFYGSHIYCEPCARADAQRRAMEYRQEQVALTVPEKYRGAELSHCDDKLTESGVRFAEFVKSKKGWGHLVISGTTGTGKTYFAAALAKYIAESGLDVRFIDVATFDTELKKEIAGHETKGALMRELTEVDVLVLDDLGNKTREYAVEMTGELYAARNAAEKPMITTTNLVKSTTSENGIAKFLSNPRAYSRFMETCRVLVALGDDKRLQTATEF